ncbi:MAG: FdhF/YdeP family oxidoreductase [Microscillaceae bacterium]
MAELQDESKLGPEEAARLSGNKTADPSFPKRFTKITLAQPPEAFTGLKLTKPKTLAAGYVAIASALQHVFTQMKPWDGVKALFRLNQKNGFDCPGCAWPDPDDKRSLLAEYCENGAKAIAEEATKARVDPAFFAKYAVSALGQQSDYWLGKQGRLTHPMVLRKGATHYAPISWEEAFQMIASQLKALPSPDEAIFYTSGRTSNEAAFLYQLFVRQFGTNNLPDCSNMCHESSGKALTETLGIGKGSVTLEDFKKAELILVIGQNPGTNHPRMLTALQENKQHGGQIITINPLPEAGLMNFRNPQSPLHLLGGKIVLTDVFLPVKINGDVALLKAIMWLMLQQEDQKPGSVFDWAFIREKTQNIDALLYDLRQQDFSLLVAQSGVEEPLIYEAANLIMAKQRIIICWAMGLTQHKNGVANIRECVNLLLLKGSIGKPGAGTCPVRGHSNVQGDRTMGIWEAPKPAFLDKLKEVFDFEPPRHHGLDVVHAIQQMAKKPQQVFIALGGNFLSATPDTEFTAQALRNCALTVQISTKLNRSHVIHGQEALILPCLGRSEQDIQASGAQFVSVENSMGVVHQSKGHLRPASPYLFSEPAIVAGMAKATLGEKSKVDWDKLVSNYDHIRNLIEQVIPGFDNYNARVRLPGGFYLPNGAREGRFDTQEGKALFTVNEVSEIPLAAGQYLMMTIRTHDQFNTTIYGLHDRYRGIYHERRVVMMHKDDIREAGLRPGEVVNLVSHYEGEERVARKFIVVEYPIPRRCVATYFPEANVLVPRQSFADKSHTPTSKSVVVSLEPLGRQEEEAVTLSVEDLKTYK